ncbi:MAG: PAS domain S-box protein [bacterium]
MANNRSEELKNKAEAYLKKAGKSDLNNLKEADELIEDLKLYQAELMIQNEELLNTQASLESAQKKYFQLYDLAPMGFFNLNKDGVILEVNLISAEMLGIPRTSIYLGKTPLILFLQSESQPVFAQHIKQIFTKGGRATCELVIEKKTKTTVIMESCLITEAGGQLVCLSGMVEITALRQAERYRAESENKYHTLFDGARDAIVVADTKDGTILDCNKAAEALFERSREELIGKPQAILHPSVENTDHFTRSFQEHLSSPDKLIETQIITQKGQIKDCSIKSNILDIAGKQVLQGIFRDITEQKIIERQQQEQMLFLQTLIETIPNPLYYKGVDGRYIGCNRAFEQFFGKTKDEIIGKTVAEVASTTDADVYRKMDEVLFRKPGHQSFEHNPKAADGSVRNYVYNKATFNNKDGLITGIVGVISDITNQKNIAKELQLSKEQLEKSLSLLNTTLNSTEEGILAVDLNRKVTLYNQKFITLCSIPKKVMEAKDHPAIVAFVQKQLVKPDEYAEVIEDLYQHPDKSYTDIIEFKDGRFFERNYTPQMMGSKVVGRVLSLRDISMKIQAEKRIHASEELYRTIFTASPDGIAITDLVGNVEYVSPSGWKMFGYNGIDEAKKMNVFDLLTDFEQPKAKANIKAIIQGKKLEPREYTALRKDKSTFSIEVNSKATHDHLGKVVKVVFIIRDITDRKKADEMLKHRTEELEKSQKATLQALKIAEKEREKESHLAADLEKFKIAVETASDQIVITDPEGIILYGNRATETTTGYKYKEFINKKAGTLWSMPMDQEFYKKFWNTIKNEKKTFEGDIKNKRKNGTVYDAFVSVSPVLNHKKEVVFFVGIERDITRFKEIDRMKSEFVSIASHQLRTPLTSIRWCLEILIEGNAGKLPEKAITTAQKAADASERMVKLVSNLLNLSRIELGKFAIQPVPTDAIKTTSEMINQFTDILKQQQQKISFKKPATLPKFSFDPGVLQEILENLISNSIKYSPQNTGNIIVSIKATAESVEWTVKDNGLGIPDEDHHRLFTRFFRAENVVKRDLTGTGLGLYIVKELVDAAGGKVSLVSKENHGTTVTFSFPKKGMKKRKGEKGITVLT